jgi:microcystin-dependent protein
MSDPFVAEIRIVGFNFAPTGWATCDGQLLPISQNTALFSLLGTQYGGDGKSTFALPDFQGSAPIHQGQGPGLSERFIGELGGSPTVTLLESEIPAHTHSVSGTNVAASLGSPVNNLWAGGPGRTPPSLYQSGNPNVAMGPTGIGITGGGLPHNNMQPFLCLLFIIALQGIFPPRS